MNFSGLFIIDFSYLELIAGKLTRLLVGARNTGSRNFVVESIDGSLRYPQDFTYYIQNFTALRTEKVIESNWESTFEYLFMPSETFNGRPMGLVVLINYRNDVREKAPILIFLRLMKFSFVGWQTIPKCCLQPNHQFR